MVYRETKQHKNLLPMGGMVNYYGVIFTETEGDSYYQKLLNEIEWKNDEAVIFGRLIITKRKVSWYGDAKFSYTYSKRTRNALPWTKELLDLKEKIENITGESYNSCLLNLYHNGDEGVAWHSDDEKSLGKNSAIASLSFGAERKFMLKHKETKETVSLLLEHNSLLVMKGETQANWVHSLPKSKRIKEPRINLTFRMMV